MGPSMNTSMCCKRNDKFSVTFISWCYGNTDGFNLKYKAVLKCDLTSHSFTTFKYIRSGGTKSWTFKKVTAIKNQKSVYIIDKREFLKQFSNRSNLNFQRVHLHRNFLLDWTCFISIHAFI